MLLLLHGTQGRLFRLLQHLRHLRWRSPDTFLHFDILTSGVLKGANFSLCRRTTATPTGVYVTGADIAPAEWRQNWDVDEVAVGLGLPVLEFD